MVPAGCGISPQAASPGHILSFSLPMFLGNLLQALYNTVDSFWVGRFLGPEALGAVSISFPIIFALISLVLGLTMASTTMVAQYRGAGQHHMVRKTVANSHLLIAIVGAASTLVGLTLSDRILRLMQTPPEIFRAGCSLPQHLLDGARPHVSLQCGELHLAGARRLPNGPQVLGLRDGV